MSSIYTNSSISSTPTTQKPTMTTTNNTATGSTIAPFPKYFTALAANYTKQTGNSTRDIFAQALEDITALTPITPGSVIHDNAAGPGTATSVLFDRIPAETTYSVTTTDNAPAMVAAARDSLAPITPPTVTFTTQEMDSLSLSFPDAHFTHSILNFSIFNMADPLLCLREIHRTLQPGGLAAILTWKRFAAGDLLQAAQRKVRPDMPVLDIVQVEFTGEGALAEIVVRAGFKEEGVRVLTKRVVVTGENLEGLQGFFVGGISNPAMKGWSEEEVARWPEAAEEAVREEVEKEGGVLFEAWVVLARK